MKDERLHSSEHGRWYLGAGIGASWPQVTNNHFVATGAGWPDDHYVLRHENKSWVFSGATGYQWATAHQWLPFYNIGVDYTYFPATNINGHIFQYSLPQFWNYAYQYKIMRQTLLGTLKANFFRYHNLMSFFEVGLGGTANTMGHFTEVPHSGITPRSSPFFHEKTTSYFSYRLGAGLDYIIAAQWWLGIGYYYQDFGHASTHTGGALYNTEALRTRLTDQSLVVRAHYFFKE